MLKAASNCWQASISLTDTGLLQDHLRQPRSCTGGKFQVNIALRHTVLSAISPLTTYTQGLGSGEAGLPHCIEVSKNLALLPKVRCLEIVPVYLRFGIFAIKKGPKSFQYGCKYGFAGSQTLLGTVVHTSAFRGESSMMTSPSYFST